MQQFITLAQREDIASATQETLDHQLELDTPQGQVEETKADEAFLSPFFPRWSFAGLYPPGPGDLVLRTSFAFFFAACASARAAGPLSLVPNWELLAPVGAAGAGDDISHSLTDLSRPTPPWGLAGEKGAPRERPAKKAEEGQDYQVAKRLSLPLSSVFWGGGNGCRR